MTVPMAGASSTFGTVREQEQEGRTRVGRELELAKVSETFVAEMLLCWPGDEASA